MNLVSIRIITDDVDRLVGFYETVTGATAERPVADFAEIATPSGTLAIGSTRTVPLFAPGSARPASNRSAIVEFLTEDVDALLTRLKAVPGLELDIVTPPRTMPWGNRALIVADPDGNLVNFFTPVTDEAAAKYDGVPR